MYGSKVVTNKILALIGSMRNSTSASRFIRTSWKWWSCELHQSDRVTTCWIGTWSRPGWLISCHGRTWQLDYKIQSKCSLICGLALANPNEVQKKKLCLLFVVRLAFHLTKQCSPLHAPEISSQHKPTALVLTQTLWCLHILGVVSHSHRNPLLSTVTSSWPFIPSTS